MAEDRVDQDTMGDFFNAMRKNTRAHRAKMLSKANTDGWHQHTPYHYSRVFSGKRIDWWPSGGKAQYDGRMVYGHRKVNALINSLIGLNQ